MLGPSELTAQLLIFSIRRLAGPQRGWENLVNWTDRIVTPVFLAVSATLSAFDSAAIHVDIWQANMPGLKLG